MMDGSHGISADRSMHRVFILDSESSVHYTGDRDLLSDFCYEVEEPFRCLRGATGNVMLVLGTGSIHNENFQVKGVLYVPKMNNLGNTSTTVFSVFELNKLGFSVFFKPDGTKSVMDCKGEIVGKAREAHGLHMLDYLKALPNRDQTLPNRDHVLLERTRVIETLYSFLLVLSSMINRATRTQRPLDVSGQDATVAEKLDAAVEGEQTMLATEVVVQPKVAEVSARSYKGSVTKSRNRAVQLEAGESSRRMVSPVVKERAADGVKGKGDVVKVDQLQEDRTKAVVLEAPRETTAAVVQAVAESTSWSTNYLISPAPNRRLKKNITSWIKGRHLGSGSCGSVYEAISGDGFFFAAKEVSLVDEDRVLQLEREVSLLSRWEHENIVQYLGTDKKDGKLYIFLELVTKGSLEALYKIYPLQDSQVSAYTRQILNGLHYLHQQDILHRDIKCANILVDASGLVKLADFGFAKEMSILSQAKSCKGTVYWMAPEVVRAQPHGPPADIWSLGCTVLEMLTRKVPYPDMEWVAAFRKIGKGTPPEIPNTLSEDACDFIKRCVQPNPNDRPSAAQLLEHPFVQRSLQQYGL